MKNLLIYVNPRKDFGEEEKIAIKIQIDNSLDLGWKKEDIMLVTNFPYKYNGVKSLVLENDNYYASFPQTSKINVIIDLFKQKLIKKKIYWYHDLDAYQLNDVSESELNLDETDMYLSDYGRLPKWNTGSIFFKNTAEEIFKWIKYIAYKHDVLEEDALWALTGKHNLLDGERTIWGDGYISKHIREIKNINNRIKKANITYNFNSGNIRSNYAAAIKPIKVAHFHFLNPSEINFFLLGTNKLNVQIVPERLVQIFNKHGVK